MKNKKAFIATLVLLLLSLLLALVIVGCCPGPEQIAGTWSRGSQPGQLFNDLEFSQNGTFKWGGVSGKYSLIEPPCHIKLQYDHVLTAFTYKYSISGNILTLDDEKGNVATFQRVK